MAGRRASRETVTRDQWAALIGAASSGDAHRSPSRRGRTPISRKRIVDAALRTIEAVGYDRLTMRTVAEVLDTGPASLYQHVRNKSQLGDLLVGELCSRIDLPTPDTARWPEQFIDVCAQLRDQFLHYPGLAQVVLAAVPADLAELAVAEALFTLLLSAGASPRDAAWTSDAAFLYVIAYCLEASLAEAQAKDSSIETVDRAEIAERLRMLPRDRFPNTVEYAAELTAGKDHERFEYTLRLMLRGLTTQPS